MNKINTMILAVVAASLILVAGCYDGGPAMPEPEGYDGFITNGWASFHAGDYDTAMEWFQQAIDMNVSKPEGFLGAGWCSVVLPDYWVTGEQFDYMAVQHDGGNWPVAMFSATVEQDLSWTTFVCVSPALTADDYTVINAWGTTDTLIVAGETVFEPTPEKPAMDNYEIGEWLYDAYSNVRFQYTYEIDDPNVTSMFVAVNGFSQLNCAVDSIENNANSSIAYISVPYLRVKVGDDNYRTWCMYENAMVFEYATYESAGGQTPFANDAVAAYGILQDARGENGNALLGAATLIGLADEAEAYSFEHYAGIDDLKLKGMAAAIAFRGQHFRPALGIVRSEGYGLNLETTDPDFLIELMQAIEEMLL